MAIHEDHIEYFIPKKKPNIIILGTMGSINARTINGQRPSEEFFFYNNNRNHFWKVIQLLFEPNQEPNKDLSIKGKKDFLEKHGIAITNIVQKAKVPNSFINDPSDTVLFESHKKGHVEFKKLPTKFQKILKDTPMFFTCRYKKGINDLLEGFFESNKLTLEPKQAVWFWATPTRCNPLKRSLEWKSELEAHINKD